MFAALLVVPALQGDPAADLRSDDAGVRLAAVERIAKDGHAQAEVLLLPRLEDEDWEVAALAAAELGELGSRKAFDALLELALEGPVRSLRRAAGEALARVDAAAAFEKLVKKVAGDDGPRACEALVALAPLLAGPVRLKELEKLVGHREPALRRAAVRALIALADDERAAHLAQALAHADPALRAAALEAAGASGDARLVAPLAAFLGSTELPSFLERRAVAALRELVAAHPEEGGALVARLAELGPPANERVARALGALGEERAGSRALEVGQALAALKPLLAARTVAARAAAAAAAARIASEEALATVATLAREDPEARVRRAALAGLAQRRSGKDAAPGRSSSRRWAAIRTRARASWRPWRSACAACPRCCPRSRRRWPIPTGAS